MPWTSNSSDCQIPSRFMSILCLLLTICSTTSDVGQAQDFTSVTLATFDVDVTPPVGNHMAYDPVKRVDELTLRSRGIILKGDDPPIVLCAVDFLGIGNEAHDAWREAIAAAAGTTFDRVALHTLHQHDAPHVDYTAEQLLRDVNAPHLGRFDSAFARQAMLKTATAVNDAMNNLQPVTHVGFGSAEVTDVASNRRILGEDGKVRVTRFTATRDAAVRAEPVGTIDPMVNVVSFWNADVPVAVLSYYAVHPQSYYRMGIPSPDFPGIARFMRQQAVPSAVHVHFNGAGGNIGAGKYNDGSHENRVALATRLADGMKRAFDASEKTELAPAKVAWTAVKVTLPMTERFDEARFRANLLASATNRPASTQAAQKLAWLTRQQSHHQIDIPMLALGDIRIVHMPGELFVEYQLAAKAMRPDLKVAMAAYGDYGPCYIGTTIAYNEGGYETSEGATNVSAAVEPILIDALHRLLRSAEQ
ncbi:MAG: hypothetical protein O2856_19915 [Planctomycetota bacterium]|nr:hypothetical protein [Planctomycetota bacterium]